jgi:peptidoglycan/xylan/chitin deacetylase (PgdA/CDA1 family)
MEKYFVKTPWWLKRIYSSYLWSMDTKENAIWLSFDDGPHPEATPFVLDELKKYHAKATFFCIGKNVMAHPHIYKRILDEGHAVGNHTQNHLNGWKTKDEIYLANVSEAAKYIDTNLFRPPYGRITSFQARHINRALKKETAKIVMWDVLSGDFDDSLTSRRCLENVTMNAKRGSIIIFHDSEKAFPRLRGCLPQVLEFFDRKGFRFEKLENL